jgi:hypothetical protein
MKNKLILITLTLIIGILVIVNTSALDTSRVELLTFGHVLYVSNVTITPETIAPGSSGVLRFNIENTGAQNLLDLVITMNLPAEISNYNGLNNKKIASLGSGENATIEFGFIVLPTTLEGVYRIPIDLSYLNYIGDQRDDNETVTFIVKSNLSLDAQVKSTELYKGNKLGGVSINIINGNIGNIKFLNIKLNSSKDYSIISNDEQYIGDLNSDDFSVATFRIEVLSSKSEINLPIILTYKDALNQDHTQQMNLTLKMLSGSDAGVKRSYTGLIFVIIILAIGGYIYYRKRKSKNLIKNKKANLVLRKDSIFKN